MFLGVLGITWRGLVIVSVRKTWQQVLFEGVRKVTENIHFRRVHCQSKCTTFSVLISACPQLRMHTSPESHPIKVKTTAANDAAVVPEDFLAFPRTFRRLGP